MSFRTIIRDQKYTSLIVWQVGTADGISFFLPGVVSGFAKVMQQSSRANRGNIVGSSVPTAVVHTSGAAGWPAAVEEAIKGLTEMLVIVLGDEKNVGLYSENDVSDKPDHVTATAALETLQGLSLQRHNAVKEKMLSEEEATASKASRRDVIAAQGMQQAMIRVSADQTTTKGGANLRLRSPRTNEWLDLTSARVHGLLSQTFPLVCMTTHTHLHF